MQDRGTAGGGSLGQHLGARDVAAVGALHEHVVGDAPIDDGDRARVQRASAVLDIDVVVRETARVLKPGAAQADRRRQRVQLVEVAAQQVRPQPAAPGDHRIVDIDRQAPIVWGKMRDAVSAIADITREAFHVEEEGLDWRSGLAGAVAAVGPLAVGMLAGDATAGFTATIGGLNTALVVPRAGLRARLWWGGAALIGGCGSIALSKLVEDHLWTLLIATLLWAGLWAFWREAGRAGALLGFATAAVFVIMAGLPGDPGDTASQFGWYALGGIPALALMVVARRGNATPPVGRAALAAYRRGLTADRALAGHALRLALAVGMGTLVYRLAGLDHGYWIPLTILAILQPDERATRVRVIQRAAGTLGGAVVIVVITLAWDDPALLLACAAVSAFGLYALDHRSYYWLVVLLTPTVLFMISAVRFQGDDVAIDRVANSSLGIVIGLVIGETFWTVARMRARLRA